jgi:signal peptide peptidase SppA
MAESRDDVKAVLLDIDSPGGMVTGTPELADQIEACDKPVFAWSDGLMASAAYWLGVSADQVYTSSTAEVGSIGVYLPWRDSSKMMEDRGIKTEVFRAGKFKGMGYPGTSLNDEQRALLQAEVDDIYDLFASHVQRNRLGRVNKETMQGQTFRGKNAIKHSLIDGVMPSMSSVRKLMG